MGLIAKITRKSGGCAIITWQDRALAIKTNSLGCYRGYLQGDQPKNRERETRGAFISGKYLFYPTLANGAFMAAPPGGIRTISTGAEAYVVALIAADMTPYRALPIAMPRLRVPLLSIVGLSK